MIDYLIELDTYITSIKNKSTMDYYFMQDETQSIQQCYTEGFLEKRKQWEFINRPYTKRVMDYTYTLYDEGRQNEQYMVESVYYSCEGIIVGEMHRTLKNLISYKYFEMVEYYKKFKSVLKILGPVTN